MTKKENLFKEVVFDETIYQKVSKKYVELAGKLPALLATLAAEGLPKDWAFIQSITETDNAFRDWVIAQKLERQKAVFLTNEEKKKISDSLNFLYDMTIDAVNEIRRLLSEGLPVVEIDDLIVVDLASIEKMSRESATTRIDANKLQEYWEQVEALNKAFKDLREYEEAHGLPDFVNERLVSIKDGIYQFINYDHFVKRGGGAEYFQEVAMDYFKKTV